MSKEKKAFKDTLFGKILGKAGDIVGDSAGIILKATVGGNPMGAAQDLLKELSGSNNPKAKPILDEMNLKMAEIELEFSKVDLEETVAYLGDIQNARQREISMANSGKSDWFMYVVGMFVLVSLVGVVYVALFVEVKDENMFYFIAGNVFTMTMTVVGYFFGSSKGSKDKTAAMAMK